jgi:Domain of unknown function (DUF4411)
MSHKAPAYLLDTCVWVNFRDHHDLQGVLTQLSTLCSSGRVKTIGKVMDELKRRWPQVHRSVAKLDARIKSALEMDQRVILLAGELLHAHPFLGRALTPYNTADPWLIAAAKVHGFVVVTDEGIGRRPSRSMKGVCSRRGVECLDRHAFAAALGVNL